MTELFSCQTWLQVPAFRGSCLKSQIINRSFRVQTHKTSCLWTIKRRHVSREMTYIVCVYICRYAYMCVCVCKLVGRKSYWCHNIYSPWKISMKDALQPLWIRLSKIAMPKWERQSRDFGAFICNAVFGNCLLPFHSKPVLHFALTFLRSRNVMFFLSNQISKKQPENCH